MKPPEISDLFPSPGRNLEWWRRRRDVYERLLADVLDRMDLPGQDEDQRPALDLLPLAKNLHQPTALDDDVCLFVLLMAMRRLLASRGAIDHVTARRLDTTRPRGPSRRKDFCPPRWSFGLSPKVCVSN
jgi:hypothetical protein